MAPERKYLGKVVVISGAAGGLGQAFARRWHQAGATLALLDLDGAAARRLAADLGADQGRALGLTCDVTREADCLAAVLEVVERLGGVDVLINNAGITQRSAFAATQSRVFRRVMDVNFFGSLYLTQAALPSLTARRGQIVVITSVAGFAPLLGRSGYAASKHALHGLFGSLRAELAGSGVTVTLACPGFTQTGIATAALDGDGTVTSHPQSTVGRVSTPTEVAEAVFHAAQKDRPLAVFSAVGKLTWWVSRLAPNLYEKLMTRKLKHELQR
ncbi:MAG: SDR family oxidoreductase [Deltaproteobacteria bacterium]|nr:SDR family oxidoreductase [Deltaproteobacteria bacterium]